MFKFVEKSNVKATKSYRKHHDNVVFGIECITVCQYTDAMLLL